MVSVKHVLMWFYIVLAYVEQKKINIMDVIFNKDKTDLHFIYHHLTIGTELDVWADTDDCKFSNVTFKGFFIGVIEGNFECKTVEITNLVKNKYESPSEIKIKL